ncbi:AAA family ATPase [Actinophytocola sp.]|uniref:AAA family ATPase n=1 Tax=Actinophytocola sp. TaxID=1872138 RepID=UPI002D7EBFED|nr:AAA family ATPase [Actinophytocola sp.]HET9142934.1 AAA family ATPase [Actinophytocola sp.]
MAGRSGSVLDPESIAAVRTLPELSGLLRELRRHDAGSRAARELSYRELAVRTGWSRTVIGDYFTGQALPPADRFDALVVLLGATPAQRSQLAAARNRVADRQRGVTGVSLDAVRLTGSSIVDREAELDGLAVAVKAAAGGSGGAVFLCGEAGIGKTRLATEVARLAAESGLRVLRGRTATPAVQFRALSEALLTELREADRPADPGLLPYYPALSRLIPEYRAESTEKPEDSLIVLAEAVLRFAVAVGRQGTLLVLEDLHDADQDTLTVVDYLVDHAAGEPLLLLGTVRSQPSAGLDLVRSAQHRPAVTVFGLPRMSDDAVRRMAGACLDVAPDGVPEAVLERLLTAADGLPLHVEELLAGMVGDRLLVQRSGSWTTTGSVAEQLPVTLAATLTGRVDRQRPRTRAVLAAAALLGQRFAPEPVGAATGTDDAELVDCLREAVEAQLVVPDGTAFRFRHALTAEALRARLLPMERAPLARRLATALSDVDFQLAAELWHAAGEDRRAGELFGAAGRHAAAQGAVSTAVALLERAASLVDSVEFAELLVDAYADAGRIADAYELGARWAGHSIVHLRLARVAVAAGHWEQGLRELAKVPVADPAIAARVDATAAQLVLGNPTPDRFAQAELLAGRALRAARRTGQPEVACEALNTLGRCARQRDLSEADELYRRGLSIADEHGLLHRKVRLLYNIGAHDGIRDADPARLLDALALANEIGAVEVALDVELELAVVRICRGEYAAAERGARRCEEVSERLRLRHNQLIAVGVRVFAAAHAGPLADLDALLETYRRLGGEQDDDLDSAVRGFGVALCLLRHEQHEQARDELEQAAAVEAARPASYLSLVPGARLLLAVLADRAGWPECAAFAASAQTQAAWNRQFLLLARAVLHGRAGQARQAQQEMARFLELSQRYPLAHHLGLRLVAPHAIEDGWGDPVSWLRTAEVHFHDTAPAVARACRVLLREAGAPVSQHREGSAGIPRALRELGVTVREFQVLRLLADRLSNKEIGRRLYLSPRTVEKHVASLFAKTGEPDRARLSDLAEKLGGVDANMGVTVRAPEGDAGAE